MPLLDIIGDIHGQADKLERLLQHLGYRKVNGAYRPCGENQKVVFLGDFIDRGPDNQRVLAVVRNMIEEGHAFAVMGNHEYNAICFHTPHPESGQPLRPHSDKNLRQHASFLAQYPIGHAKTREVVNWFKTLPLCLELSTDGLPVETGAPVKQPAFRFVHACWSERHIEQIRRLSGGSLFLNDEFLVESATRGTSAFQALETVLKGPELPLPEGSHFYDKDQNKRSDIRYKWWSQGTTYREVAMVSDDQIHNIPDVPIQTGTTHITYPDDAPPVFFGHYWMNPNQPPRPLRHNAACLDFSAGKNGPLVAYRIDTDRGDCRLLNERSFVRINSSG